MHLFENYGNITQLELEDNDTKMRSLWDPNSPFDCLGQQLEDGQDYTDDGGQPYTAEPTPPHHIHPCLQNWVILRRLQSLECQTQQ